MRSTNWAALVAAARPVSGSSAFRDPGRWPQSDPRGRPLSFAVASRPSRFFLPDGSSTGPVKSRATGPARWPRPVLSWSLWLRYRSGKGGPGAEEMPGGLP